MGYWHRVGIGVPPSDGTAAHPVVEPLVLFVPSSLPNVTCWPPGCGGHLPLAAAWALGVLGRGWLGGQLVLISDSATAAWVECLAAVMAVDDAAAGGHRPPDAARAGLVDRILRDPRQAAELVAAARL